MDAREAVQFGDFARIKQLLDSGEVDANWTDSDDCSLLHWASINNRLQVAELLIARGANVSAVGGVLASTPLHWAARQGHVRMVALLLKHRADMHKRDVEGFTALHVATQFSWTAVVAYLIAKGQSVDAPDESQMTPLMWTAYKVHTADQLRILLSLGADVNLRDATYGNTPLHWATVHRNHIAIRILLAAAADPTQTNAENETPLDVARRLGDSVALARLEAAAKRDGHLSAGCGERLVSRPRSARRLLFCLPFFLVSTLAFLLSDAFGLSAPVRLAMLILVGLGVRSLFVGRVDPKEAASLLPVSTALALKSALFLTWFLCLQPIAVWWMQITFTLLLFVVPILYGRLLFSDPGFVTASHQEKCATIAGVCESSSSSSSLSTASDPPSHHHHHHLSQATNSGWRSARLCHGCVVLKTNGISHCSECGRCVAAYDHHCPWIGNCVGARNRTLFIGFLASVCLSAALFTLSALDYWTGMCGADGGQDLLTPILHCFPWLTFCALLSLAAFFWTLAIGVHQLVKHSRNEKEQHSTASASTAHSSFMKGQRYSFRNPFSRLCRCVRVLFCSCCVGSSPSTASRTNLTSDV